MTPQSAFMIQAEVRLHQEAALCDLLASINGADGLVDVDNDIIPFNQFDRLHFARLLIIESPATDDISEYGVELEPWPKTLVFLGDCDGPVQSFLAELAIRAGPGLSRIFSYCVGFEAENSTLLQWLMLNNVKPSANYVNWIGRSVNQVLEEIELHSLVKFKLHELNESGELLSNEAIHPQMKEYVNEAINEGRLTLSAPPPTPVIWWIKNQIHKIGVPLILVILTPLIIIILPVFLFWLRKLERSDPQITPRPQAQSIQKLSASEDQLVTNQFSAFGDVKPGLFRRYVITFFLFMLDYASRHVFNKGCLTRVRTIHFARWVLLDNKRRVFFASNYDGDLESYMDDFINKVGWGLNLVFSNGVGWPATRWLVKGGASHEQPFKYYLRRHQLHTNVWYKAYPDATAVDLDRNSRIRIGLEKPKFEDESQLQEWLNLI